MCRKIAVSFSVIILGLVALAGFFAYRAYQDVRSSSQPQNAPVQPAATSQVVFPAPTIVTALATLRFELSEQQVNQLLQEGLAQRGYKIDDLRVRLEEGRFVATTTQQMAFLRVPVTVIGEASVVDGQLAIRPTSVSAAGASMPQAAIDQLASAFRSELAAGIEGLPVRPASVEIHPGKLIVQGVRK